MNLHLTKHHGLGNDFLVLLDAPTVDVAELVAFAVQVCDRRRGIGADGLLVAYDDPHHDARMLLLNADGSRAEMSGNGIRCFAQAIADRRGGATTLSILTDAGVRVVELTTTDRPDTLMVSVDMGAVAPIEAPAGWDDLGCDPMRPVAHLSLGNPHTVVGVEDVGAVDLLSLGLRVPTTNLEIVEPGPEPHAITMRVHERGAGLTEACGTGACASAWAAASWGLVPASIPEVTVHMPGGSAKVRLGRGSDAPAVLVGPTVRIGDVTVETAFQGVSA
jgi:diaminopimelate epimerase